MYLCVRERIGASTRNFFSVYFFRPEVLPIYPRSGPVELGRLLLVGSHLPCTRVRCFVRAIRSLHLACCDTDYKWNFAPRCYATVMLRAALLGARLALLFIAVRLRRFVVPRCFASRLISTLVINSPYGLGCGARGLTSIGGKAWM